MKKTILILVAFLIVYCADTFSFTRLNPDVHHFVSIDASFGYASMNNYVDSLRSGRGVASYLGVGYRLLYNQFLFAPSVEAYYLYNANSMSEAQLQLNMIDTEGDPFLLFVDATQGRDWMHAVNMNIPLLFGMEYKRFYFLAGPKFSLNIFNRVQCEANVVKTAVYDRYIGVFEDMPNHMLDTYPLQSDKHSLDLSVDVLAHLELGVRLGDVSFETGADIPKPLERFYIAIYADYGLLNLNTSAPIGNRLGYEQSPNQSLHLFLTPAMLSCEWDGVNVNQWSLGVKATVLIELPKRGHCVMCDDVYY